MVNTRSNNTKAKEEKMTTAKEELKCYFEKLIEPLVTNNSLEELFKKLKDEKIMKKLDEKISEQNAKIEKLESIITIHENTIDQLLIKCDDNEQYSRRSCLRIHRAEVKENEDEDGIMNVLEDCYSSVNLQFDANDIDRAHRTGLPYTDKNSGKKVKSIIVKFRSWKARQRFYKGRPRNYADSSKKPGFTVSVDLTKRRYLLLTKAKGLIKGNSNIKYVYSDINCSLALRFNDDSFKYFNGERELLNLLNIKIYNPYHFCVMRHVMIIALFLIVYSEIPFGRSLYCVETSQLVVLQINWLVYVGCMFLLSGVFE